jgi:hypothetical protein
MIINLNGYDLHEFPLYYAVLLYLGAVIIEDIIRAQSPMSLI